MTIPINLASQPFRRDRPMLIASSLLALVLVSLLGFLVFLILIEHKRLAATRSEIARVEAQLRALAAEQNRQDMTLGKPENQEVLERTVFLNTLIYRKGISWTRMLADLEKTLPYNVRLISIRPQVTSESQVSLDMIVGAETTEPIVELLVHLESSELFGATTLSGSMPPSQTDPLYRYRISANYARKL